MMQRSGGNTMTTPLTDLASTILTPTTPILTPTAPILTPTSTTVKYPATVGMHLNYYFDALPISWGMEIIPLPIVGYEAKYGRYIYEAISN